MPTVTIFLAYIAVLMTLITWALMKLLRPTLRQEHKDPKERRPIISEIKKIVGTKPKGSVFIPPSEAETERQRIIDERRAAGLDTPIEILRENDDES